MKHLNHCLILFLFWNLSCLNTPDTDTPIIEKTPFIVVLGIAQDAGYPQAACAKACCKIVWQHEHEQKMVSCLAVVDPITHQAWMFDATPDFKAQLYKIEHIQPSVSTTLAGIFLTHAHIGHYTGLIHLGREAIGTKEMPVFAMPSMKKFLENNGPWSQLVDLKNIQLNLLHSDSTIVLNDKIRVTPFQVPHRDEFSETVGYKIQGPEKSVLFIPDIDKWQLWEKNILDEIKQVDHAFLDGSFFQNGEIPGRDMSEIPHPFIEESLELFQQLDHLNRQKIQFIHLNHTNPALFENSRAYETIEKSGCCVAKEMEIITL